MEMDEVSEAVLALLPEARVVVASQEGGAPDVAWGDRFFYVADAREDSDMPFATIVRGDYPGFDEASQLDREGVYRLNLGAGREAVREVSGDEPPDFAALDRLLPHPTYAAQGWVCVLNPSRETFALLEPLLLQAHARAARHAPAPES